MIARAKLLSGVPGHDPIADEAAPQDANAIVQIAFRNIRPASIMVSSAPGGMLSIAVTLFAGFVGPGRVADKINGVISKLQGTVDKSIDAGINAVAKRIRSPARSHPAEPKSLTSRSMPNLAF